MAGYPPPYPPPGAPYGPPYNPDPRTQARILRDQLKSQARTQKMAFRAQRMAYRDQARALRRTSILGPLLVVGVGVVLLLIRLDRIPFVDFAFWYGRWWPLLFVAAGIVLALEWAFDQYTHHDGVPFVRRRLGGGVVVLLIFLALLGGAIQIFHIDHGFPAAGWHVDDENLGELFGERHDYQQELDEDLPPGATLNIDNPHGDVTVVGRSGDGRVHIVVDKQIYSWGDDDASSRSNKLDPRVTLAGGTLSVSLPWLNAASADLSVTVPDSVATVVSDNHGAVNVSGIHAAVNVTANHGDIDLERIAGPVNVHTSNTGSSFTAHGVQGDLTLRGHADDLTITDVTGGVSVEGEFYGDTHLEHLGGPSTFRTSRTQFSIGRLDGMVDISSDEEFTGSQIVGPTLLHTRSRNISLERVAGPVDISNSNGTVDLTASAPLGNVSINNASGEVTVTVPEHSGVMVQTETRDGAIQDDLDNSNIPENSAATHSATVGDGAARLSIVTSHADITIHKGLVEPPTGTPPPPLSLTPPPTTPVTPMPPAPGKPATKHHLVAAKKTESSSPLPAAPQ